MPLARVFLCHSSIDKPFVDRLASDLERVNVSVWYDKWEIRAGDSLVDKVSAGIESNDYLAVTLTPNSVSSDWVRRELNAAFMRELDEKRVVILPLMVDDCAVPVLLRDKKWADFREGYESGFDDFLLAVAPESPATFRWSKAFRTVQYLVSGLAATDDNGTNTLNSTQIRKIYPYRKELAAFVGTEEKRLLFWSAIAFKHASPTTPDFLDIAVPVWGLTVDMSDEQYAKWILEGLSGPLFDNLIRHYEWAARVLDQLDEEFLSRAFVVRSELADRFTSPMGPMTADLEFFKAAAREHRVLFDEQFLPNFKRDLPSVERLPTAPSVVESTAELSPPLDDSFYFSLFASPEPIFLAAVKALARLRRPSVIELIRKRMASGNRLGSVLDKAFSELSRPEFVAGLTAWLSEESAIGITVRILASLSNAGAVDGVAIEEAVDRLVNSNGPPELLPTLLRIYARAEKPRADWVAKWIDPKSPVVCEAAVFGLARLSGPASATLLLKLFKCESETVLAAVIEALAKSCGMEHYEALKEFSHHQSPVVRSGFYRSLVHIRPLDWKSYMSARGDPHPLACLCAARCLARMAASVDLEEWLGGDSWSDIFGVTADEMLFAPRPFAPRWILQPEEFDPRFARLAVRLTNFDPDRVWLDTGLDLSRMVGTKIGRVIT